ncbi:MAG: hypothetical protein ABIE74_05065 [Pseudomonadota bacterium]
MEEEKDQEGRQCPLYEDHVRSCVEYIRSVKEISTLGFCVSEKHEECPFYRSIKKIGSVCEMVERCPIFKALSIKDFELFRETTKEYCLSQNNIRCKRYILKKAGKDIPLNLMPDGSKLSDDEK